MSEAVRIIRQLLVGNVGITAAVPAARIQADILPQGTPLPAIRLESVSGVPLNTFRRGASKHVRERIQVTALAANYDEANSLSKLIFAACADKFPDVDGLANVSVLEEGEGPDGFDPDTMARAKPTDFVVRYNI